jgi:hypothetical protein
MVFVHFAALVTVDEKNVVIVMAFPEEGRGMLK